MDERGSLPNRRAPLRASDTCPWLSRKEEAEIVGNVGVFLALPRISGCSVHSGPPPRSFKLSDMHIQFAYLTLPFNS